MLPFKLNIVELNTESKRDPRFRMEFDIRQYCLRCNRLFKMDADSEAISKLHFDICQGDAAITLMKIGQLYGKIETAAT